MTKQLDNLDLNNSSKIINSRLPVLDGDLTNKSYVDTEIQSAKDYADLQSPLQETGSNGFVVKKDDTGFEIRTLEAGSNKVSVSNGTGISGNPSIDVNEENLSLSNIGGTLGISQGGTGQTTANDALNALLPSQTSANNKYLKSDGTNVSWDSVSASTL